MPALLEALSELKGVDTGGVLYTSGMKLYKTLLVCLLPLTCLASLAGDAPVDTAGVDTTAADTTADSNPYIDLYGSDQVTLEQVEAKIGPRLQAYLEAITSGDREAAQVLDAEITEVLQAMGDFALVELSRIQYFTDGNPTYLTIDLVDADDRAARMTFAAEPTGQVEGVEELLAAWSEYQEAGFALLRAGTMPQGKPQCPAYHCVFGFPGDLAAFGQRFEAEVPQHQAVLERVLREDADFEDRAHAAFLLAHIDDGAALVQLMLEAIDDPSSTVRNNALRVLGAVATDHPQVEIPLDPILRALDYPLTTDRNKVLYVLSGLAKRPELQAEIARRAGATLIDILRLRQPNNHDFAYQILQAVSGEDFGARDYEAWKEWFTRTELASPSATGPESSPVAQDSPEGQRHA